MTQPIYLVDAFTDKPFGGNPAGVCPLVEPRDDTWKSAVAAELKASATAFLEPRDGGWYVRWFTPRAEVDLCGHGTLAAAHVLWETGRLRENEAARFDSRSGALTVRRGAEMMEMELPERRESAHPPLPELFAALGAEPVYFGKNAYDYFAVLASADEVKRLTPDFAAIRKLPVRGVIVSARGDEGSGFDFVSRFFAPGVGLDEDPVTGSAHCCLGPYWSARLGRRELLGHQASKRSGVVRVRVEVDRVFLGGKAVTIVAGELGPGVG